MPITRRNLLVLALFGLLAAVVWAQVWVSQPKPHVVTQQCQVTSGRACTLTYTDGTLTGISWRDR